jgi:hypothetical protein
MKSSATTTSSLRSDIATQDSGKVRLGDADAPSFGPAGVSREPTLATKDSGKVRLGDADAPSFGPGMKIARDPATGDSGKVRLGDGGSPVFGRA